MIKKTIVAKTLDKLKKELKNKKELRDNSQEFDYHTKGGYKQSFYLEIYDVTGDNVFFMEEGSKHKFKAPIKVFKSIPSFDKILKKLGDSDDTVELSCSAEFELKNELKIKSFKVDTLGKEVDAPDFGKYLYDVLDISEYLASGSLSDLD